MFFLLFNSAYYKVFAQEIGEGQTLIYTKKQQKLRIESEDIKLIPERNKELGGYHLFVKKRPNIESILLTETTKDPQGKSDNYAYRAKEYNKINGDEIRILDGKKLESEGAKYSLVDSTVENTSFFGPAFHIYIPPVLVYGYKWSRNGEVKINKGTFVNIRSFDKPYADYTGNYVDNPFMFDFVPKKETIMTDDYNPIASDKFKEMSKEVVYSKGPETIINDILKVLNDENLKNHSDIVFAIDATGSMKNDIEKLKKDLLPALEKYFAEGSDTRVGLLFYRDYGDSFRYMDLPVKIFGFTKDFKIFAKNLNSVTITGLEGGDIPEAVYEAMYAAAKFYDWRAGVNRQVILIGDAEPHPTPRGTGKYSKEYVMEFAKLKGIKISSILLPQE